MVSYGQLPLDLDVEVIIEQLGLTLAITRLTSRPGEERAGNMTALKRKREGGRRGGGRGGYLCSGNPGKQGQVIQTEGTLLYSVLILDGPTELPIL